MSWRLVLALAVLLSGTFATSHAGAATTQCIPAARFASLARITDGSMSQLAELVGLAGKTPPSDACRAILLSGALTRGSAAALMTEIDRNKGWLATVYIAVADGDLQEEIEIAQLMRDFRLAGQVAAGPFVYMPDFLVPPRTSPASVSSSWPAPEQDNESALAVAFKDYLENTARRIRPQTACGAACWTILSGVVERGVTGVARASAGGEATQSPENARIRDAVRGEHGTKVVLVKQTAGYLPIPKMAGRADVDRNEIDAECKPAVDYAATLGREIAEASDRFAKKQFPFMRLQPFQQKVRRFVDASGNAELCVRKVMTRLRMAAFSRWCPSGCDSRLKIVDEAAAKALAGYGPSTPTVSKREVPGPVPVDDDDPDPVVAAPAPADPPAAKSPETPPAAPASSKSGASAGPTPAVTLRPQRRR